MIFSSYSEQKEELAGIRLVSCGHVFAEPGREVLRPYGRDDWLLFYVAKEEETFFLKEKTKAKAGSFIIYAPGEVQHHIYEGNKTAEFYYVHFKCSALPKDIRLETSRIYSLEQHKDFASVFEEIIEETLQKKPGYESLCISLLLQLFSRIKREAVQINAEENKHLKSVMHAIQHMNRFCESTLDLDGYASMCCMSKYHFSRTFKAVTGVPPLEYRNRIRIEHAKELLLNSFLSINEIGNALGYTSPSYFSDAFKKSIGISPKEYRNQKNIEFMS